MRAEFFSVFGVVFLTSVAAITLCIFCMNSTTVLYRLGGAGQQCTGRPADCAESEWCGVRKLVSGVNTHL